MAGKIDEAQQVLADLGLQAYAGGDRNVLTFLALCHLAPGETWSELKPEAIGVTPVLDFIRDHFGVDYAPNTRETIRKDSIKPLERLDILIRNFDEPGRPTNSPLTDYTLDPVLVNALRSFGTPKWPSFAERYRARMPLDRGTVAPRKVSVPVKLPDGTKLKLSPGPHSELIRAIVEEFTHHFTPGGAQVAYVGDTADNLTLRDERLLMSVGIDIDSAAEKPDVILWYPQREWLFYLEAVYSSGHIDEGRKARLAKLSSVHTPIYVSCFLNRRVAAKFLASTAHQTEVWVADEPSHLLHLNGERFLGPYR